jgi:hypothetical protein
MNDSNAPSPPGEAAQPARNKGKLTGPKPPLRPDPDQECGTGDPAARKGQPPTAPDCQWLLPNQLDQP